jgi:DNA-binding CsgD family transcriptional regulator
MPALRQRDCRAILEFVEELYACPTLDAFMRSAVHGLPRIIPSDVWTFNDIDHQTRRINWIANTDRDIPNSREVFLRHMHEHPSLTQRGSGLYNEFYRPFLIEQMLGVMLAVPPPRELHVVAFRNKRDFDEREREALGLLAPHLSAGVNKAEAADALAAELAALRQGFEADGRAVILLGPARRVRHMSERARDWLSTYFAPPGRGASMLPPPVEQWLQRQETVAEDGALATPRRPLVIERAGRRLTVRVLKLRDGLLLLLGEQKLQIGCGDLASLGLSPRETEVLTWLAGGKTNGEIAAILGLSPLTIKHCVERIYHKLDVRTRAAATAIAVAAAGARH